jgi:hypothetical protein
MLARDDMSKGRDDERRRQASQAHDPSTIGCCEPKGRSAGSTRITRSTPRGAKAKRGTAGKTGSEREVLGVANQPNVGSGEPIFFSCFERRTR